MTTSTPESETHNESFVETALKLSGKSEEEARTTGAVDRADEQVEDLFAPKYQTAGSPAHRAVWDAQFPTDLFVAPVLRDDELGRLGRLEARRDLFTPLTGDDLFVTNEDLERYFDAADGFWREFIEVLGPAPD